MTQIEAVVQSAPVQVQVGGGIRNMTTVRRYFKSGISRIVLGTGALKDRAFLRQACQEFRRILLGLDARDGKVAVRSWTSLSETTATHLLKELAGSISAPSFIPTLREMVC